MLVSGGAVTLKNVSNWAPSVTVPDEVAIGLPSASRAVRVTLEVAEPPKLRSPAYRLTVVPKLTSLPTVRGMNPSQFGAVQLEMSPTWLPERATPAGTERMIGRKPSPAAGPWKYTPCDSLYWSLISVSAGRSSKPTTFVAASAGTAQHNSTMIASASATCRQHPPNAAGRQATRKRRSTRRERLWAPSSARTTTR